MKLCQVFDASYRFDGRACRNNYQTDLWVPVTIIIILRGDSIRVSTMRYTRYCRKVNHRGKGGVIVTVFGTDCSLFFGTDLVRSGHNKYDIKDLFFLRESLNATEVSDYTVSKLLSLTGWLRRATTSYLYCSWLSNTVVLKVGRSSE